MLLVLSEERGVSGSVDIWMGFSLYFFVYVKASLLRFSVFYKWYTTKMTINVMTRVSKQVTNRIEEFLVKQFFPSDSFTYVDFLNIFHYQIFGSPRTDNTLTINTWKPLMRFYFKTTTNEMWIFYFYSCSSHKPFMKFNHAC